MEPQELEKIIRTVLASLGKAERPAALLVFSGDSRYLLERFYLEARKICGSASADIVVEPCAQPLLEESRIGQLRCGRVYGYGGYPEIDQMLSGIETVIAGSLDIGAASKIANLITDSLPSKIVSLALLKGIRVLSNDFAQETDGSGSGAYALAVRQMAETVKSYGVTPVRMEELGKCLGGPRPSCGSGQVAENVITESFIRGFQGEELKLGKGAVLTPLARDLARERKIRVLRG